jgi:SAM-dependent methyltransferase
MTWQAARYDGHADWYDENFAVVNIRAEQEFLRQSLGAGNGEICVDVACGTGLHGQAIAAAGYRAVGVDISADQLRFARGRLTAAVQADACCLPMPDRSVAVAVGMFFHTDVEDFAAVLSEVARILQPAGRLIYIGLHPCFIGPFVSRTTEARDLSLQFVEGYGNVGWTRRGSGDGTGVWSRVGGHHKTLASFLNAITGTGLLIHAVREFSGGGVVLPRNLGVVAQKR